MSRAYWAILRATITVGSYSLVVKAFSVVKEGLVAYRVGVSFELDAFLLALAFPVFLFSALNSALATAFVPAFVHMRLELGVEPAKRMAGQLSWILALGLVAIAILSAPLLAALIPIVARQYSADTTTLAVTMLYMLMPVLVLSGLSGFWSGYLNANERFAVAAVVPTVTPLTIAAFLMFSWDSLGMFALVLGTNAGALLELMILGAVASRLGLTLVGVIGFWGVIRERIGPQFIAAIGGTLLLGATALVDQFMAAMLLPGSVATLNYGVRVPSVLATFGIAALATALLPHLSHLVAAREFGELRRLLRQYSLLTLAVTIPAAIALMLFSEPIVALLFERGAFDASDTSQVARVQAAYALYVPFFALSMIAARLISAMRSNSTLLAGACLSLCLNIVLNWILSRYFGVAGIALATSGVYLVSSVFLWTVGLRILARMAGSSKR